MRDKSRLSNDDVRDVAKFQKVIILCILAYLVAVVCQYALPPELRLFLGLGFIGVALVAAVFVFLLAAKIYDPPMSIILPILTLIPCVGLIVLLIINAKATNILKANGVGVGLLGAKSSDLPRAGGGRKKEYDDDLDDEPRGKRKRRDDEDDDEPRGKRERRDDDAHEG